MGRDDATLEWPINPCDTDTLRAVDALLQGCPSRRGAMLERARHLSLEIHHLQTLLEAVQEPLDRLLELAAGNLPLPFEDEDEDEEDEDD